jgi:hypothetical protein
MVARARSLFLSRGSRAMAASQTDRNLLFGVIALQLDILNQSQFAEACAVWALHMDRPMADLLEERGWIMPDDRRVAPRYHHQCHPPQTIRPRKYITTHRNIVIEIYLSGATSS